MRSLRDNVDEKRDGETIGEEVEQHVHAGSDIVDEHCRVCDIYHSMAVVCCDERYSICVLI